MTMLKQIAARLNVLHLIVCSYRLRFCNQSRFDRPNPTSQSTTTA